jgi:hypothetical protein
MVQARAEGCTTQFSALTPKSLEGDGLGKIKNMETCSLAVWAEQVFVVLRVFPPIYLFP